MSYGKQYASTYNYCCYLILLNVCTFHDRLFSQHTRDLLLNICLHKRKWQIYLLFFSFIMLKTLICYAALYNYVIDLIRLWMYYPLFWEDTDKYEATKSIHIQNCPKKL